MQSMLFTSVSEFGKEQKSHSFLCLSSTTSLSDCATGPGRGALDVALKEPMD